MQRPATTIVSAARRQRQRVVLLENNLQNGSSFVKHFPSSFHGDARALKQHRPWPEEKFKDAFNLNPTREPKRTVDVQSFNRPFDESRRPVGNYPSLVTQLPTALEPQFPSASVDQSRTRGLNAPGNLDQCTSSSTLEDVQPGSKATSKPVPSVSTISDHRRSRRAESSTSDERAPSPSNGRPVPRFETSNEQIEAGVESKNVISNQTVRKSSDGGAHLLSNSHATQISYGKSRTRVAPAYVVVDQARSSQNGAQPAMNDYQIRASRIVGSVVRHTSGVAKLYNPSLQRVQQELDAFGDQWRLQKMGAELYGREAQSAQPIQRGEAEALAGFQGIRGHGNNVAQLEAPSSQTRPGAAEWMEAAKVLEQNRNPSPKVVGGISRQQNTESLKVELEGVGDVKANLTRSIAANDVLEILEPEPPSGMEEEQCSGEGVTENSVRQDLITEELLRKAHLMDGQSTAAWMKAGHNLIGQGGLQSRASCGTKDWSRNSAQGSGSTDMHGARTTSQAIAVLHNRLQRGIITDSHTYIKVLQMCLKQKDLLAAKQVHDCIVQSGMDRNHHVAVTLLNVYIRCGGFLNGRRVFDELEQKSVIAWNAMIAGYARSDHPESALELFHQMRQGGAEPNEITYLSILKASSASIVNASASAGALEWVKEVHGHARKAGLESDLRVGNALVHLYAKSGSIDDARQFFNGMHKRDVVTWNVMIGGLAQHGCGHEAYRLFRQMRREGFEPNAITYVSILNASATAGALEWVKDVHDHARKAGLESELRVGNALVHMYAKSGSIDDARQVFDRMKKRDVFTWNVMIGGLAQNGCGHEAYQLFRQMRREGSEPDAITYLSILNASASAGALEWVKEVHDHARKAGVESDLRVGNALVHMYAKSGSIDDARQVFDRMKKRDVITWTVMIGGLAQYGCGHEAYRLFRQMRGEGFEPDTFTFASILNPSASAGALKWVKEVHDQASKAGLESDLRVGNALVHMYAESGSIEDARLVFDRMEKRDVVTWTSMIGGLAYHGCGRQALELFREMNANRVDPDSTSFVAVLSACCHGGLVDDGRRLFSAMTEDYGIVPDIVHYNCMVDLLGRAGCLEEAKLFISDMPIEPDVVTWIALLGACRTQGNLELGELAAKEVFKLEPDDAAGYVLLSNIYAAAGKWESVSMVRTMMQKRGVRKEPGRSWVEVDKKMHGFGVGDTSHPDAKAIHAYLKQLTEKLKAAGYIPDTRFVLQDINEEDKELALCSHSEKLAIAYGLMHIPRGEPIRVRKNLRVCPDCHAATKLISKVTGREIIARDANRFHHFSDGVCSCGDYW